MQLKQEGVLRISLDTKATLKIGPFSRGGYSRQAAQAGHDFQTNTMLTPFGILLPATGDCGGPRYHRISEVEVVYQAESLDAYAQSIIGPAFANTAQEYGNKPAVDRQVRA